jgi:membrane protein required for colicin V production
MAALDWIIVAILLISIISAAAEGFLFELFSFGGAIVGLLLAAWNYGRLAPWFEPYVKAPAIADIAAFITIFLVVAVLAAVVGKVARWVSREVGLRWVDRALGAAFGLLRGILVVTAIVLAAAAFVPRAKWLERSELSGYFLLSARIASWVAPSDVRHKFQEGLAVLRNSRMRDAAPNGERADEGATGATHP